MTVEQLRETGIKMDEWTVPGRSFHSALLSNEATLPLSTDNYARYYFDSETNLLFIRYFNGLTSNSQINSLYYEIKDATTGNNIYACASKGGRIHSRVGLFHDVVSLDEITIIQ